MPGTGRTEGSDQLAEVIANVVDDLAARLRRLGTRQWREQLGRGGETAADLTYQLVVSCAAREAQLRAGPPRGPASESRPPGAPTTPERPAYDAALADRLAVTGRDLALALADADDDRAATAVLGGLLLAARDLKLPRDPALVQLVWSRFGSGADSGRSAEPATGDETDCADELLRRLEQESPQLRALRPD
ncbi:MAG TPA: hypothetical protein VNB94_06970 [Mycobacteriales bacterium]|nr:hypothetical protein [Mycobacteriales bacterium]